jgi:hypothetical protein
VSYPFGKDAPEKLDAASVMLTDVIGLRDIEKPVVVQAFERLEARLGVDVMRKAVAIEHPLAELLINQTAWTRRELVRFADQLDAVSSAAGFDELRARLLDSERFHEAVSVLGVAAAFAGLDCNVAFDVPVRGKKSTAKPDVRVTSSVRGIDSYVEVTARKPSQRRERMSETMMGLTWPPLIAGPVLHAGRFFRDLAPRRVESLRARLVASAELAVAEDRLVEVVELDTLEFAFAPQGRIHELAEWAKARGVQPGMVAGPELPFDDAECATSALRGKEVQLPRYGAGVVVIYMSGWPLSDSRFLQRMALDCQEEVSRLPHVASVVIKTTSFESVSEPVQRPIGLHTYIRAVRSGQLTDRVLVVRNEHAAHPAAGAVADLVVRAFGGTAKSGD